MFWKFSQKMFLGYGVWCGYFFGGVWVGVSSLKPAIFGSFIWLLRAKYRMGIFLGVRILWISLLFRFLINFLEMGGWGWGW